MAHTANLQMAQILTEIANLLAAQGASHFRVNAYRQAAAEIIDQKIDLIELARQDNKEALEALPTIGKRIAGLIIEFAYKGECRYLNRLKGEMSLERYLEKIPDIGTKLAKRAITTLNLHSIEDFERSVNDGSLTKVDGFGKDRVKTAQIFLEKWYDRSASRPQNREKKSDPAPGPSHNLLLAVDEKYRLLAAEDKLHKIAPRRFNPKKEPWLPIYHCDQDGWHFTVMYSNTALAHQLRKQRDWVVVYFYNQSGEGQVTIITAMRGDMKGKRVIRGLVTIATDTDELSTLQAW